MTSMKILLATNESVLARGIEAALAPGGLEIAAVCRDIAELFAAFARLQPEVVIIDHMILPAIDVIAELRRLGGRCQIVLWNRGMSSYELSEAKRCGARAILSSKVPPASVIEIVNLVASFPDRESDAARRLAGQFPQMEREVLALVGYGMSDAEIAAAIHSEPAVVERVVKGLARTFDAQTRCELALYGLSTLSSGTLTGEMESWKNEIAIV